ncbi:glycosyltransferase family 2 protein [Pseudopelagicola sp. nBUS_19]|uniref:glycosyltransferase family 2 protein n=1 Tax=Pseudopelagicola sp. nBUS_19 TaxID=3395316 RepID=UPI003EBF1D87
MSIPSVLTIILNYKTPEMTLRAAAAAMREMRGLAGKIVIVDNNSRDGSFELILSKISHSNWPVDRIEVVQSDQNGGFGAGNNFGIQHEIATRVYDYVYILNSDAFPNRGSIYALLEHLQINTRSGIAGSYIHGPEGDPHLTAFRFPSIWGELEGAARVGIISKMLKQYIVPLPIPNKTINVNWVAGASMMIRMEMLEKIDLFDENFFLYFEETDLCLRAAQAGWTTDYVRNSEVTHIGSVSTGMKSWARVPSYWFDSRLHYFQKNHGSLYAGAATLAHISGYMIWRLKCLIKKQPQHNPSQFLRDLVSHYVYSFFRPLPFSQNSIPKFAPPANSMRSKNKHGS